MNVNVAADLQGCVLNIGSWAVALAGDLSRERGGQLTDVVCGRLAAFAGWVACQPPLLEATLGDARPTLPTGADLPTGVEAGAPAEEGLKAALGELRQAIEQIAALPVGKAVSPAALARRFFVINASRIFLAEELRRLATDASQANAETVPGCLVQRRPGKA